jgi:hypothetical protein
LYSGVITDPWTDLTDPEDPFGADPGNLCVMRIFELGTEGGTIPMLILTNGKDSPKWWDTTDNNAHYTEMGSAPVGRAMVICGDRVVLGNVEGLSPLGIDHSEWLDPSSGWESDQVLLADTPGEIVAMRELGNMQFVVYKTDAVYMASLSGEANTPFTYSLCAAFCDGPLSSLSVITTPDGAHMYLASDGGIYRFDGTRPQLLNEDTRAYLFQRFDLGFRDRAFGYYDPQGGTATFFYPAMGSEELNNAVMVDLKTMSLWPMRWTDRAFSAACAALIPSSIKIKDLVMRIPDLSMTFGSMTALSPRVVLGGIDGQAYYEDGYADDGDPIAFLIETGTNGFAGPENPGGDYKTITCSEHYFVPTSTEQEVVVKLGVSNFGEDPEYESGQTIDLVTGGPYELGHRISGRSFAFRFSGESTRPLVWNGSAFGVASRGKR